MNGDFNPQPQDLSLGSSGNTCRNAHLCPDRGAMFLCPAGFQTFYSLKTQSGMGTINYSLRVISNFHWLREGTCGTTGRQTWQ